MTEGSWSRSKHCVKKGRGTGKRLEKGENEMMDLVKRDSRDDSKLKLDLTGRVGAQGRCCSRKQT